MLFFLVEKLSTQQKSYFLSLLSYDIGHCQTQTSAQKPDKRPHIFLAAGIHFLPECEKTYTKLTFVRLQNCQTQTSARKPDKLPHIFLAVGTCFQPANQVILKVLLSFRWFLFLVVKSRFQT